MFDTNVKIVSELKEFLTFIGTSSVLLDNFRHSEKDFTRNRKLPFEKLVLFITKLCKKTLSIELEKFFEEMAEPNPCSVSALTQQRTKLQPLFFDYWNTVLWSSFYFYEGMNVKRWKGFRITAADGSTIHLINNPALMGHFGGQSNQEGPYVLARTFFYYDVLNELILSSDIRPFRYGEVNMAYDAVEKIEQDMLMVYDRNFASYKMVALHVLQEKERKFVIRARETQKIIRSFIETGNRSQIVDLLPTTDAIKGLKTSGYLIDKNTVLKVRLVRVELKTGIEVLMTNLWEEEGYPDSEFQELYFMRWGVETNISFQKNILQAESFSGLTVNSVLQDFYATVFMANLHSILIKDAQQTIDKSENKKKYPMKINKNKSSGRFRNHVVLLFIESDPQVILLLLHNHFIKDTIPIRKGRSFKRVRKNKQTNSKHRTFTNYKLAC
jgi:hypothetical protein